MGLPAPNQNVMARRDALYHICFPSIFLTATVCRVTVWQTPAEIPPHPFIGNVYYAHQEYKCKQTFLIFKLSQNLVKTSAQIQV